MFDSEVFFSDEGLEETEEAEWEARIDAKVDALDLPLRMRLDFLTHFMSRVPSAESERADTRNAFNIHAEDDNVSEVARARRFIQDVSDGRASEPHVAGTHALEALLGQNRVTQVFDGLDVDKHTGEGVHNVFAAFD